MHHHAPVRLQVGSLLSLLAGVGCVALSTACSAPASSENAESTGAALSSDDQAAYSYFVGKGLANVQAAGIVGNLDQESGMSPSAVQPNGPGRGIAQWSLGARWNVLHDDNATWYAAQHGQSVVSLGLQLDFIWYELSTFGNYGLSSLQSSTSIDSATQVFMADFEICGTCAQSNRDKYAQNAYNAFAADAPQSSGMDAGSCIPNYGSCSVNGSSGSCIDTGSCSSSGGTSTSGKCPGPSNIQCCTQ